MEDAVSIMRCILGIDVETGEPILPTYGGYSGSPIRPLGLATVAGIAQSTELPIFGIGGVESYKNVLEYIMGCSCRTKYGEKRICVDGPVLQKEEIVW